MRVRVLGCSGGIGRDLRTTSLLVDDDLLIDAGTGVGDLTLDEMRRIRHVFVTHSHLDHVLGVPLLVDTLFDSLTEPLVVHGLPATLEALRKYIFNWSIWPDFSVLPSAGNAVMAYAPMQVGLPVDCERRRVSLVPVNHIVPAAAYLVESHGRSFCFSGDTTRTDALWRLLNGRGELDLLIVECGFPNRLQSIAELAKHYTPATLAEDLGKLKLAPKIAITHLKSGNEAETADELRREIEQEVTILRGGEVFCL